MKAVARWFVGFVALIVFIIGTAFFVAAPLMK